MNDLSLWFCGKKATVYILFKSVFLRNRSLSNARQGRLFFYHSPKRWGITFSLWGRIPSFGKKEKKNQNLNNSETEQKTKTKKKLDK